MYSDLQWRQNTEAVSQKDSVPSTPKVATLSPSINNDSFDCFKLLSNRVIEYSFFNVLTWLTFYSSIVYENNTLCTSLAEVIHALSLMGEIPHKNDSFVYYCWLTFNPVLDCKFYCHQYFLHVFQCYLDKYFCMIFTSEQICWVFLSCIFRPSKNYYFLKEFQTNYSIPSIISRYLSFHNLVKAWFNTKTGNYYSHDGF